MADLQKTVEILFTATTGTANAAIDNLEKNLGDIGTNAEESTSQVEGLNNEVQDLGTNGAGAVDDLATAFKALLSAAIIQQLGEAILTASSEMENLKLTFVGITGSSDEAAQTLEYITEVANKLGLDVIETAKAFSSFAAATQGTAIEGDKARYIFEAVAGTMAILGKDTEDVAGVMVQLAQGVSKGKYELEDLKSIAERIPGFFDLMAKSIGVTTEELFDMISQGQITGDEMLLLAEALKNKYGDVEYVDTFSAAWQRAKNAMVEFLAAAGDSGTADTIKNLLIVLTEGAEDGATGMTTLSEKVDGVQESLLKLSPGGTMALLIENALAAAATYLKLGDASDDAGTKLEATGEAGAEAGDKIIDGAVSSEEQLKALAESTKAVNAALKDLGLDPKQFEDTTAIAIEAFETLATEAAASGDQILAGLLAAIDKAAEEALPELASSLDAAFADGRITADQYAAGINAIEQAMAGMWPEVETATEKTETQSVSLDKVAAAAAKAEEAANKYALELEKIASNERIAVIESTIALNIADLETNAKIAEAIIGNLADMYETNISAITDLLGMLSDDLRTAKDAVVLDFARTLEERSQELHDAQIALIAQQIEYLAAKTAVAASGNPLITVQGDGLAPHLESIMWEIFRQIQIKMAYDGGDMLVGGCSL